MEILMYLIFGAIIGSFLSVCIYRIPYNRQKGLPPLGTAAEETEDSADDRSSDELDLAAEDTTKIKLTIASPARSLCPSCQKQLLWWHNIPVISWILLGGKCGFCKTPIPVRYPIVELLSALFCVLAFTRFDFPTAAVVYLFCAALIVLSFIDIDYYILPNVITYPGTAIGVALAAVNHFLHVFTWPVVPDLMMSLWGLLAGGGFLWAISEGYFRLRGKEGLGLGDVKLLAMVGVLFGPYAAFATIFVGSFLGAIIGSVLMLCFRRSFAKPLPFGPYLALGTILHLFLGPDFPQDLILTYIYGM